MLKERFETTDATRIANMVRAGWAWKRPGLWATTLAITGDGYEVGVVDKGERGYTRTNIYVPIANYDEADKVVDAVNAELFPGRSNEETFEILMSSM